jgi:hypothetical protein
MSTWVRFTRFCEITGQSKAQVRRDLKAGHYRGKRTGDSPNSGTLIDIDGYNKHVEKMPDWKPRAKPEGDEATP